MQWLIAVLGKVGLNWLWGKASELVSKLWDKISQYRTGKNNQDANNKQAEVVEKLRQEIIALRKAGQPIPLELEKRLGDEVAKLIADPTIPHSN